MEEWSIRDLDFSVDDFTMECAYDLLTAFVYKSGQCVHFPSPRCLVRFITSSVKVHLLRLSDGDPHPCAKKPLLEYEIPLSPTERGWALEVVIRENRLGCLFTSALGNECADHLVVWDWTTGDLVKVRVIPSAHSSWCSPTFQVLSQCGNRTFVFLNEDTIVAGRPTENASPSLSFFDLSSDEKPIVPYLTLGLPDEEGNCGGSLRIRLNLGIPIHLGPELRVRVPFVVNPAQQMLLTLVFFVDPDDDMIVMSQRCIAIPLSTLQDCADGSLAEWDEWRLSSPPLIAGDPRRATFSMGSRFVTPDMDAAIEAAINAQPFFAATTQIPLLVYNLSPHRRMRVWWEPSQPHCQGISGVWNTVAPIRDNGSYCRTTQILAKASNVLMTEDSLIVVEMVRPWSKFILWRYSPRNYRSRRAVLSSHSRFYPFNRIQSPGAKSFGHNNVASFFWKTL